MAPEDVAEAAGNLQERRLEITEREDPVSQARRWAPGGFALAAALILSSACGGPESVFVLGAGLASFVHTDKLPTDYVGEMASGLECSLLQSLRDGGPICRESFERRIVEKPVYCYRTLGEPTCYATPDPYRTGAQPIR